MIENDWLTRILHTPLYQYTFEPEPFKPFEEAKTTGYYISEKTVHPLKMKKITDGLERIANSGIEIRVTPHLQAIKDQVISSTLDFSIIRFRHARKEI
jgi:replicative superfamily II helicase